MARDNQLLLFGKTSYFGSNQVGYLGKSSENEAEGEFEQGGMDDINIKYLLNTLLKDTKFVYVNQYPDFFKAGLQPKYLQKIVEVIKSHNNLPRIIESNLEIKEMKVIVEGKFEYAIRENSSGSLWETIWSEEFRKEFKIDTEKDYKRNEYVPLMPITSRPSNVPNGKIHTLKMEWTAKLEWSMDSQPPQKKIKLENDNLLQALSEDESKKDFTIVSGDGVEMKCHKWVLSARKWFEKMPENPEMAEAGKLKLNGLSGEGLKLFMKYLYGLEIPVAELTPRLALDLLRNGHAYEVPELVEKISAFLLGMDKEWFEGENEIDSLLELYLFMSKLEGDTQTKLTSHLLQILAWIPAEKVKESQSYQKLDKDAAIDLISKMHETVVKELPPK